MYEQYFREFVMVLFPNDLLDVSILDFIEGERTIEAAKDYEEKNGVNIFRSDGAGQVVILLSYILEEMRKKKEDCPKKDLIDYYLDEAMKVLKTVESPNFANVRSFRSLLFERGAQKRNDTETREAVLVNEKYLLKVKVMSPGRKPRTRHISFVAGSDVHASEIASCRLNDIIILGDDSVGTEFGAKLFRQIPIDPAR